MTEVEIREAILAALHRIAPEADVSTLRPDADLRQELDIDSVDFLGFVIAIHDTLGIDVPEADYGRLRTVADCVRYLAARVPGGS